jgi:hypothetical protein
MAHLYSKNLKTSTAIKNEFVEPATMISGLVPPSPQGGLINTISKIDIPVNPVNEIIDPSVTTPKANHITFMSYEEYLKDIESMCKQDRMFMERVRSFCYEPVEEDEKNELEQSLPSEKSSSKSKRRSK